MQTEQQQQEQGMQMQHEMMNAEHQHEERMQDKKVMSEVMMNSEDNQTEVLTSREKLVQDTRKRFSERQTMNRQATNR